MQERWSLCRSHPFRRGRHSGFRAFALDRLFLIACRVSCVECGDLAAYWYGSLCSLFEPRGTERGKWAG